MPPPAVIQAMAWGQGAWALGFRGAGFWGLGLGFGAWGLGLGQHFGLGVLVGLGLGQV